VASWQVLGMEEELVVAVVVDLGVAALGQHGRHVAGYLAFMEAALARKLWRQP
jgi:hypothetical protein